MLLISMHFMLNIITDDCAISRFTSLDKSGKGHLTREDFLRIPELAINPLGDRIVHAFFYERKNGEEDKVDFKVKNKRARWSPR